MTLDKNIHILVVDDDEVDIENLQRAFKKNNIVNPIHIAHNGVEALDMLRGTSGKKKLDPKPKIILLDINMPKMNGLEFLEEIRKDKELRKLAIFILTTSNDQSDITAAYEANVAGYITKPVTFENFTQAVKTLKMYWSLMQLPL